MADDATADSGSSRIPGFFRLTPANRRQALLTHGHLSRHDFQALTTERPLLDIGRANHMIENVIGVMGLPLGVALNFLIDDRERVIPLCVEEPSIVAGLSAAALTARNQGGYQTQCQSTILSGQVQLVDVPDPEQATVAINQARDRILAAANALHPRMVARGGGATDFMLAQHDGPVSGQRMLVLNLYVDSKDAMGANLVNSMCEGIAPLLATLSSGRPLLRILSNLADRALVQARVHLSVDSLAGKGFRGEEVRDAIVQANDLALVDPYRATTHNKGIMNGIDALALATGNDWRAMEAAAHAYAARDGQYRALTRWYPEGDALVGELTMPVKVGTVGGSLTSNPAVAMNLRLLGEPDAETLARITGAVGLAQNFAALRALVTSGIQYGHMRLHARSVAASAGVPDALFDQVVQAMIDSGEIKQWKAAELAQTLGGQTQAEPVPATTRSPTRKPATQPAPVSNRPGTSALGAGSACGKVILLGEHAVVYGAHALAAPIPMAVHAQVHRATDGVRLHIPDWRIDQQFLPQQPPASGAASVLHLLLSRLDLAAEPLHFEVQPAVPKAMGLGGSAALAVALIRALDQAFRLNLDDARINALALEAEQLAHGRASGIDNTVATYGHSLLFQRDAGGTLKITPVQPGRPVSLVIAISGQPGLTADLVSRVRQQHSRQPAMLEAIFAQIDGLSLAGAEALQRGNLADLGDQINLCQGLLNALQVSTPELEALIDLCRRHGALGAKLTGAGGGGSVIALCDDPTPVTTALRVAGYRHLQLELRPDGLSQSI